MSVLTSRLPPDLVRVLCLRRLARNDTALEQKLGLLSRLRARHDAGLDNFSETQIEQSFNERIFSQLFDYTTVFSDLSPGFNFNILPKRYAGTAGDGSKHFDDFAIGIFSADPSNVTATVELKSPNADLDKPQGKAGDKGYKGKTPVEQAMATAALIPTCRWVIVCNFADLRLYHLKTKVCAARVDLRHVRNRDDIALLLAHFDRRALVGLSAGNATLSGEPEGELNMAFDKTHAVHVVAALKDGHRIVFRSGPSCEEPKPLFKVERATRNALREVLPALGRFLHNTADPTNPVISDAIPLTAHDGWLSLEGASSQHGTSIRLAVSRYLEIVLSCAIPGRHIRLEPGGVGGTLPTTPHERAVTLFFQFFPQFVNGAGGEVNRAGRGIQIEGELLDAQSLEWNDTQLEAVQPSVHPSIPTSSAALIHAGPFSLEGRAQINDLALSLVRELAIHFRSTGGGLLLDDTKLRVLFPGLA